MSLENSPSIREPQLVPTDHIYVILQDHGPEGGGWGPSALDILGLGPHPIIYTGTDTKTIMAFRQMCSFLAKQTGKETRLCLYRNREDVFVVEP